MLKGETSVTPDSEYSGHAIILIGTQEVIQSEVSEQYVLFLDPNDASVPGEERSVYRMSYETFSNQVMTLFGVRFTKADLIPEDAIFAVAGPAS